MPTKTKVDLIGQQIGRLEVIEYLGDAKWFCRCSCGKTATPTTFALTKKQPTRSCGCLQKERAGKPRKDLTGYRSGQLLVIGFSRTASISISGINRMMWECLCDCGKTVAVRGCSLMRKDKPTKSCGCLNHFKAASPGKRKVPKIPFAVSTKKSAQVVSAKQSPLPKQSIALPDRNPLTESQLQLVEAEHARIIAALDSDLAFWATVNLHPEWRDPGAFRDWIAENLPPTIVGSRLTRISRYGGFEPGNLRWSDPR